MFDAEKTEMSIVTLSALILVSAGLLAWAGYAVQGSYLDDENVLREAFYLLAIGWFAVIGGGVILLVSAVRYAISVLRRGE